MSGHAGWQAGTWRWSAPSDRPGGGFVIFSDASRYDAVKQRVCSMIRAEE